MPTEQRYISLINARLLLYNRELSLPTSIHLDSHTGLIVDGSYITSTHQPDVVYCMGMIVSPGMIDIQINGAFGVDLSEWRGDAEEYLNRVRTMGEGLVRMGITRYVGLPQLHNQG